MTPIEALSAARAASVRVYERKVELAHAIQRLQADMAECDAEFLRLDGEIRVLTALTTGVPRGE